MQIVATDICGTDTTLTRVVKVENSGEFKGVISKPNRTTYCPGEWVTTNYNSEYHETFEQWFFDSDEEDINEKLSWNRQISFNSPGVKTYRIEATDYCGNDSIYYGEFEITGTAEFDNYIYFNLPDTSCVEEGVYISAEGVAYAEYNLGNGQTVRVTNDTIIKYDDGGSYNVEAVFYNYCNVSSEVYYDTIYIKDTIEIYIERDPYGIPELPDTLCLGEKYSFGLEGGENIDWEFSDGLKKQGMYISHTFNQLGTNVITATSITECGTYYITTDTFFVSDELRKGKRISGYGYMQYDVCLGDSLTLEYHIFGTMEVFWGDGESSFLEKFDESWNDFKVEDARGFANHLYKNSGTYNVIGLLSNVCGVVDTVDFGFITVSNVSYWMTYPFSFLDRYEGYGYYEGGYCKDLPVSMMFSGGSKYFVDYGDGETEYKEAGTTSMFTHKYDSFGVYTVVASIESACGAKFNQEVKFEVGREGCSDSLVSFVQKNITSEFEIFPNPTIGVVNFSKEVSQIKVFSAEGLLMMSHTDSKSIDISKLSSGLYIIMLDGRAMNVIKI